MQLFGGVRISSMMDIASAPNDPHRMPTRTLRSLAGAALLVFCVGFAASIAMARTPKPPASPFEVAAECVAVLKQDLKSQLHARPTAQENDAWKRQAESAFAHAGDAYHAGVSEEQAQQMLDSAEERVAAWSADRVKRQSRLCLQEGSRLLDQATPVDKLIVRNAAKRWLARQLRRLEG